MSKESKRKKKQALCSFCGKTSSQVDTLIEGTDRVFICQECTELCANIFKQNDEGISGRTFEEPTSIVRSVTLPGDFHHLGLSLIGYIPFIIMYKYADLQISSRLQLEGRTVRLVIDLPKEHKETIVKLLNDYGAVVQGKMAPSKLLDKKEQIQELHERLQMTELELTRLAQIRASKNSARPSSQKQSLEPIEENVTKLQNALGWIFQQEVEDIEELLA